MHSGLKKNAKSHTHYQNITQNIQFLAVCHGTEIRKNDLKKSQKQRQHHTGINRLNSKLSSTGEKNPMISNTTFRIMVIADSCSGTKLQSTIPRPEILLTDVWLGTRQKIYRRCNDRHCYGEDHGFLNDIRIIQFRFS